MDQPPLLPPATPPQRPPITVRRVVIWVVVGGIGVFLLLSGILGIIAKG